MKTILVPTDHSAQARHALRYALELAAHTQANLVLLHVFHQQIPVSESGHLDSYLAQLETKKTRDLEDYAQQIQADLSKNFSFHFHTAGNLEPPAPAGFSLTPGGHHYLQANPISEAMANLPIKSVAVFGDAGQKIVQAMDTFQADLVVMGMRGAGAIGRALLGSVATEVMLSATVPTLVLPENSNFRPYANVVYALDLKTKPQLAHLAFLQYLAKTFAANLVLLHLYQNEKEQELNSIQEAFSQLDQGLPELDFTVHFQAASEVTQALEQFAQEQYADLLVLVPHQHTYLDVLQNKSVTGTLTAQLEIPLLALPAQVSAGQQDISTDQPLAL